MRVYDVWAQNNETGTECHGVRHTLAGAEAWAASLELLGSPGRWRVVIEERRTWVPAGWLERNADLVRLDPAAAVVSV